MQITAKIFKAGNSQALRLPKAFRMDAEEVTLQKDDVTGVITITPRKTEKELHAVFNLIRMAEVPASFMQTRDNQPADFKDIF